MRATSKLARRYAEALGLLANERGLLERVEKDLESIRTILEGESDFQKVFMDPWVPSVQKRELVHKLFDGRLAKETVNFLVLLIRKRRETYLPEIIDAYVAYANQLRGILDVEVISAQELDRRLSESLIKRLSGVLGTEVRLRTSIDSNLLGGVQVRVGDLLIDGSAASRLARLERNLKAAQLN